MNAATYNINRSVHLGRRDVFFAQASELFHRCLKQKPDKNRTQDLETTAYYLRSALEHSVFAAKSTNAIPIEKSLILFIHMILFCLHSALTIIENEYQLKNKKSPLWMFLHQNGNDDTASDFARSGEQRLDDVSHLFHMVEEPCRNLQKSLIENMTEPDRDRYTHTYKNLKKHVSSRTHRNHVVTYGRIFYPTLPTRNE